MNCTDAKKDYKVEDFFQITLPENWEVRYPIVQITLMSHSSDKKFRVKADVRQSPIPPKDIDEYMSSLQKQATSSKDSPHKLEESGSSTIGNQKARWLLFSSHSLSETKDYWLIYRVNSGEYSYGISFEGDYNNLEADRSTINEIISNFKMLK